MSNFTSSLPKLNTLQGCLFHVGAFKLILLVTTNSVVIKLKTEKKYKGMLKYYWTCLLCLICVH